MKIANSLKRYFLSLLVLMSVNAYATPFTDGNFSTADLNGTTMYNVFYESDENQWYLSNFTFTDTEIHMEDDINSSIYEDTNYSITAEGYIELVNPLNWGDSNVNSYIKIADYNASLLTLCWRGDTSELASCTGDDEYFYSDYAEANASVTAKNDYIAANSTEVTLNGQVTFVDENNVTIAMPADAGIRITSDVDMQNNNWGRFEAPIDSNGSFSVTRSLLENTYDENNTFQVVVFKNHINTSEFNWDCGEDTYKYLTNSDGSDNVGFQSWSNIVVTIADYQDRSSESCGDSYSTSSVIEEITVIETELANATDMPEDLRIVIETLLADAYVILAVEPLDETALTNKLAEIYAIVDTIGNEDAYLYGTNASKITGTITLPADTNLTSPESCFDTTTYMPLSSCNAIFVDLMATDGEWLGSTMISPDGSYNLFFRELTTSETIDATVQVHLHLDGIEEHYFYDFGDDHAIAGGDDSIKSGMEVEWVEDTPGMWNPVVNHLAISTSETIFDVDISSMDDNKYVLEGTVVVPADFTPGEIWGTNGERLGFQMVNITAINTTTGEHYWTEIGRTATDTNTYPFAFKLPNSPAYYIIRIEKMSDKDGAFEWVEMYLNDGGDNTFGTNSDADTLVSNTGIMWDTAKDSSDNVLVDSNGHEIWIPDTTKTGYFTVNDNVPSIAINIATYGDSFKKIAGIVTPPTGFELNYQNHMNVDIIDAKTGWWIGGAPVMEDGSYSLILGDTVNSDGYIIRVNQDHWDETNWQDSWWKGYYYDLGTDNAVGGIADTIKDEMDVRWTESAELDSTGYPYWVPNVNPLIISDSVDLNISFDNYDAPTTYSVTGTISGIPTNAQWVNVHMYDPINYTGNGSELKADGSFEIQNIKAGKYILEVNYDLEDNGNYKHYHYIITDDDGYFDAGTSAVDGMDIKWVPYNSSSVAISETSMYDSNFDWSTVSFWAPEETDSQKVMLDVSADVTVASAAITQATFYNLTANITGLAFSTNVNFNLFVPNEPIGRWANGSSASDENNASEVLQDLKARDDYQLQIWVDGLGEFWYDANTSALVSDVTWVGIQNDAICENWQANISTCDWNASVEWKPNLDGFSINADATLDLAIPNDRATITAVLSMGADDANKTFDVNMWQNGGSGYSWESFEANATGDITVSLSVKQGLDYRMEVYNPASWEGFVVDLGADNVVGGGDDSLITNQNSWATDGAWGPKASTLIDLHDDNLTSADILDLGTLTPPTLKTVSFIVENLAADDNNASIIVEDIWIGLEDTSTNEWYGNGNANWEDWTNPTYSDTVTVKVPADGTYFIHVYPMIHKAGMVDTNGSGEGVIAVGSDLAEVDFTNGITTTVWNSTDADTITIANDTNVSVTLKLMNDYKSISGTITLSGTDASESGWICATAPTDGKCSEVESDGSYVINGIDALADSVYQVEYWANSGEMLRTTATFANSAVSLTGVDIEVAGLTLITISGTVTDSDITAKPTEIVLLDVNGTDWFVMDSQELNITTNNVAIDYSFSDLSPNMTDHHYEIAVATPTINQTTGVASYVIEDANSTDGNTSTNIADDTTITITVTQ